MASPELREVIRGLQALRGIAQISAVWLFVKGSHSEPFGFAQGKLREAEYWSFYIYLQAAEA